MASLAALPPGLLVLHAADADVMKRAIAAVIAVSALIMLSGRRYRHPPGPAVLVLMGAIAGFVLGATYIALVVMTFLFAGPDRGARVRANAIFWGFVTAVATIGILGGAGAIAWPDVWRSVLVGLVYLGAAALGARVFRRADEGQFRRVVLGLLLVLALIGVAT